MKSKASNRLLELDAMRGIAALMVVFFHFTVDREQAKLGFNLGVTGVDFFFIISGFVIFLTLSKTKHWMDFVVSRFSRLYPAYWAALIITAIAIMVFSLYEGRSFQGLMWQVAGNMTMFNHYMKIPNLDGSYWTLIIEMQFYIIMLLVFRLKWLNRIVLLGTIGLGAVLFNHFVISEVSPYLFKISRGLLQFVSHLPLFFAGILFYKIKFESRDKSLLLLLLLVACFIAQVILFHDGGKSMDYISQGQYTAMLALYFAIFTFYAFNKPLPLVNGATMFLGKISYSLYLIHQHIGSIVIINGLMKHAGMGFWPSALFVALPAVILLAAAITYLIEQPALQYIRKVYAEKSGKRESAEKVGKSEFAVPVVSPEKEG